MEIAILIGVVLGITGLLYLVRKWSEGVEVRRREAARRLHDEKISTGVTATLTPIYIVCSDPIRAWLINYSDGTYMLLYYRPTWIA